MDSTKNQKKPINTKVLEVEPDTAYTVRVLEETLERVKSRQDEPNIVYNILSHAMGELIPFPSGEMFEKHQLASYEPDQNDYEPSEGKMRAFREVEAVIDELKADQVSTQDIQAVLLDEFIRLFPANPYRDPVNVELVERDYLYAEYALNRLESMMTALYRALNRAASKR